MATHKIKNTQPGPRGFWHQDAVVMVDAGASVDVTDMTDDEVKVAKATGYFDVEGEAKKADATPDYERDGLKDVDIDKPATSKPVLLVIAAYEGASVPEGDEATKAEIIAAIKAKRAG